MFRISTVVIVVGWFVLVDYAVNEGANTRLVVTAIARLTGAIP